LHGYGQIEFDPTWNNAIEYDPGWQPVTDWRAWLDEDVRALLTSAEREKFLALKTNEERQQFARKVWQDTDKQSHYERLEYAKKTFAFADLKGSQTDRGLVYARFGPPDSISQFDSTAVPHRQMERWSYRNRFDVVFYKTDKGEYSVPAEVGIERILKMNQSVCAAFGCFATPLPELPNEFSVGKPPVECRCEGFEGPSETLAASKHEPYMEISFSTVTNAATRITLFMSNRRLWFGNKNQMASQSLEFRGRILSQSGKVIVRFTDMWTSISPPDTTWPLNRCERIYLSPGGYRLEIAAFDWSTTSQLAHCTASIEIPEPKNHQAVRLPAGNSCSH
jgi:GWxTD domain-containing protein